MRILSFQKIMVLGGSRHFHQCALLDEAVDGTVLSVVHTMQKKQLLVLNSLSMAEFILKQFYIKLPI
jgi:hypothetical protein